MPAAFARAFAAALLIAARAAAADGPSAITTQGAGMLTMCESYVVYQSCNSYHHVAVPARIAVGDRFKVSFGSNSKDYEFPAARITKSGDGCTVWGDAAADPNKSNRIDIAPCGDTAGAQ